MTFDPERGGAERRRFDPLDRESHDDESRDTEEGTPPPPELKRRVIRSLRKRGVLRAAPLWRVSGRVAAALALFIAGALAGRVATPPSGADQPVVGPPAGGPGEAIPSPEGAGAEPAVALAEYLLVLQEPSTFRADLPLAALVREYGAWAGALRDRGRLVVAERLEEWSAVLPDPAEGGGAPGLDPPLPAMTGFFLVRAEDRAAALALARTHPHLGYGGRVVVMEVGGS